MTSVDSGSTATQKYNALDQRVERFLTNGSWTFDYLFGAAGEELGVCSAGTAAWFDQDVSMGRRILVDYGSPLRILHTNKLGTTTVTTDQTGAELQDELFYPWGQDWTRAGLPYVMHFAGMQNFENPGLVYPTDFRRYNPALGRWMSPDPMGGDVTNPQSFNRYAYVLNNPTTLTDPLGLNPYDGNPGDPCNDPAYADGHAECPGPGGHHYCDYYDPGCDTGYGGGGRGGHGGHGGSGGSAPGAPPAGQPPIGGNSLLHQYPCLSTGQLEELEGELIAIASAQLRTQLSAGAPPTNPVFGGAQNVYTTASTRNPVYVDPQVISQAQPADPLEQLHGWHNQLIVPDTHLTGPGNVVHILFKSKKNGAGQVAITALKIHADIAAQDDVSSGVHHFASDVFLAWWSSLRQKGCAVKLF